MYDLGIDLGGINTAAAVVDSEGKIISRHSIPTPKGPEAVADNIAAAARGALENAGLTLDHITTVGVGSPGTIDPVGGVVEYWSNLNFSHVPLSAMVAQRLGRPILLENDANAAALGEYVAGAGRGSESMVAITLGTGVGGGAVIGGKLYTGCNYAGMEVGHFVVEHGGRLCTCGRRGCYETYASATALMRRAREEMALHKESLLWTLSQHDAQQVDGRIIFAAAQQGDPTAKAVLDEYIGYLACGLVSFVNLFQPEVFCVGGGVSNAGEALMAPLRAILDREDYARGGPKRVRLVRAQLGNDAGLIGAAMLAKFR